MKKTSAFLAEGIDLAFGSIVKSASSKEPTEDNVLTAMQEMDRAAEMFETLGMVKIAKKIGKVMKKVTNQLEGKEEKGKKSKVEKKASSNVPKELYLDQIKAELALLVAQARAKETKFGEKTWEDFKDSCLTALHTVQHGSFKEAMESLRHCENIYTLMQGTLPNSKDPVADGLRDVMDLTREMFADSSFKHDRVDVDPDELVGDLSDYEDGDPSDLETEVFYPATDKE